MEKIANSLVLGQRATEVSVAVQKSWNKIPGFKIRMPHENVDMNDFLNFDSGDWNVPLEEGPHGESGGFMGDMNWIDQAPGWSRLNSPLPEVKEGDIFGMEEAKGVEDIMAL